jgi:fatty acid synthase
LDKGVVVPLPYRAFNHEQVEPAFRYMGQGKHIGKVLIQIPQGQPIPALPRQYFHPSKVYIVVGGLGGVGLEFCHWMTSRNAKKIILAGRSGVTSAYQAHYLKLWTEAGVFVQVLQLDAVDPAQAEQLVKKAHQLGPIGGVFNLAAVSDMNLMKDSGVDEFKKTVDSKITLTRNLDTLTRSYCPDLELFVIFSSVAAAIGVEGSSNYAYANSGAERIIEKRVRDGLPGKALQWGPIGDVGMWHEAHNRDFEKTSFYGLGVQSLNSVLHCLDQLLTHPSPIMLSKKLINLKNGVELSNDEGLGLVDRIGLVLGKSKSSKLNSKAKLPDLGMDSMLSVQVKQILEQDYSLTLSSIEIRTLTLEQLEEMSKNSPRNRILESMSAPRLKGATAAMFQLNFLRGMSRNRMLQERCVYPINDLARNRIIAETMAEDQPKGSVFIVNSVEAPEVLHALGSHCNLPTYSMQWPHHVNTEDIQELTDYYLKV